MSSFQPRGLRLRALLADVLPFEVPIVFTNDFFFASTLPLAGEPQTSQALALLRSSGFFTIPYSYSIVKDRGRTTQLSIIHPISQIKWATFIDHYAETIIAYCSKGEMSLRHPYAVVTQHTTAPLESEATARDGLPHELLEGNTPDFSRISSYFRLRPFNILAKFVDSKEMVSLEKRFSHMLALDIAKCFYNLYTHSIAWAVKGKPFTKANLGSFTFEGQFDDMMQDANYKETNGIVVGPEVSRIFAEIIFQQIDKTLLQRMDSADIGENSYQVRRYVDDYFIFANSISDVERVEMELSIILSEYKLYFNTDKRLLSHRPFVTPISKLKRDIGEIVDGVARNVREAAAPGFCDHRSISDEIRRRLRDLRLAVAPDEVGFHNISGWLMWKLRRISAEASNFLRLAQGDDAEDCAAKIVAAIMELAFYITALDFRVRTGFNLALLMTSIIPTLKQTGTEQSEWLENLIFEELLDLLGIVIAGRPGDSVEVCNLLLAGAHSFGERFVRTNTASKMIRILAANQVGYRSYITAKFCLLRSGTYYSRELAELNDRVEAHLMGAMPRLKTDTETYLLFCDFVSAPDISEQRKQVMLDAALENDRSQGAIGSITAVATRELSKLIGFVDWSGVRLRHTLARRQLRASREY